MFRGGERIQPINSYRPRNFGNLRAHKFPY